MKVKIIFLIIIFTTLFEKISTKKHRKKKHIKKKHKRMSKIRKLIGPPMMMPIKANYNVVTAQYSNGQLKLNLGENPVNYQKEQEENEEKPKLEVKDVFTFSSPTASGMERSLKQINKKYII